MYSLPQELRTKELCRILGLTKSSVYRRALREKWLLTPQARKLGGAKWLLETMPNQTRREIAQKLAHEMLGKQSLNPVNNDLKGVNNNLNGVPEHGQRIANAKSLVCQYVLTLQKTTGLKLTYVLHEVEKQFRERTAPFPNEVYQSLRGASYSSIYSWVKQRNEGGTRRLAKQFEKRDIRNAIDLTPELSDVALAMVYEFPHVSAVAIHKAFDARFSKHGTMPNPSIKIPSLRCVQLWLKAWKIKNEELFIARTNPDKSKSKSKTAFGNASAHVYYMNQEWQSDGTLCELILNDNRRHTINLTIDVYSRRLSLNVSRTSSSAAVASGLRKAILKFGKPDVWKSDNGKDYKNNHMERVCSTLDIIHELCPPFSPEKKPFVERAFKTLLHSLVELMPGYVGHSVAERKDIEARKTFAERLYKKFKTPNEEVRIPLSPEELEQKLSDWAEYVYGNTPHAGLDGMTPNQKAAEYRGSIYTIEDEQSLGLLTVPVPGQNGLRVVRKKGISLTTEIGGLKVKGHYISPDLATLMGKEVLVRYDDSCLGRVVLFDPNTNEYLGKAEHPVLMGWTQDDVRNVALVAENRRKEAIATEKKLWREANKRGNVKDIESEIIATAKRRAEHHKVEPAYTVEKYTNPALDQAARSRTGDFVEPSAEYHAEAIKNIEKLFAQEKPKGFVIPEYIEDKLALWHSFYNKRSAGEKLGHDEEHWFLSFAKDSVCRAYCKLHGLKLVA